MGNTATRVRFSKRKPVGSLKVADFKRFPLWKYIDESEREGEDETWVEPLDAPMVPRNAYSVLASALFRSPRGREFSGFMIVTTAKDMAGIDSGALIGRFGYACLPFGSREQAQRGEWPWDIECRKRLLNQVGVREHELFPLAYKLGVLVAGERAFRTGLLD